LRSLKPVVGGKWISGAKRRLGKGDVAFHGYGFQLEWERMAEGVSRIQNVFSQFNSNLSDYMKSFKD
jgi:hypothetical protein